MLKLVKALLVKHLNESASRANKEYAMKFSRRNFLQLSGCALAGAATGIAGEAFKRSGPPRLLLSLAAYSFRDHFVDASHKRAKEPDPATALDMFKFIDFCALHGCTGAELTSYYFPKDVTNDYLLKVRQHAFLKGVEVSGTSVGNNFARPKGDELSNEIAKVKGWIDKAAVLGAPHIRVFAGSATGTTPEEARKMCIGALEECCDYSGSKGIYLGLENHGGIVAEPAGLLEIVHAVKSPWLGVNLDVGNFHTEDPYADLAKCAPYAVNVQFKVEIRAKGQKENSHTDLAKVVKLLRDANYQGYCALEYEAKEDPFKAVPENLKKLRELFAG
jgi:sugar phosphate isomerase/epimerase